MREDYEDLKDEFQVQKAIDIEQISDTRIFLKIVYLSIGFIFVFSSVFAFEALSSQLFDQFQFKNLGQISLFFFYLFEFLFCSLASHFQKYFTYRQMMWASAATLSIYVSFGIWINSCSANIEGQFLCQKSLLYVLFISFTALAGAIEASMWCAVSGYINMYCKKYPQRNDLYFSIFFGVFQLVIVVGMIFSYISFSFSSLNLFFFGLSVFCFMGCLMLFKLNEMMPDNIEQQSVSGIVGFFKILFSSETKNALIHFKQYTFSERVRPFALFFLQSGFTIGFIMGDLYIVLQKSLGMPLDSSLLTNEQAELLNLTTTKMQILLGFTEILCYFILGSLQSRFEMKNINNFSFLTLWLALVLTAFNYMYESVSLCFLCSILWGLADCIFLNQSYNICRTYLDGSFESYSLYNLNYGLGVCIIVIMNLFIKQISFYLILIILFLISLITFKTVKYQSD